MFTYIKSKIFWKALDVLIILCNLKSIKTILINNYSVEFYMWEMVKNY